MHHHLMFAKYHCFFYIVPIQIIFSLHFSLSAFPAEWLLYSFHIYFWYIFLICLYLPFPFAFFLVCLCFHFSVCNSRGLFFLLSLPPNQRTILIGMFWFHRGEKSQCICQKVVSSGSRVWDLGFSTLLTYTLPILYHTVLTLGRK